jgi:uncharacterized protein YciI
VTLYAVTRSQNWDPSLTMEQQRSWDEHAAFMDDLVDRGIIVLGGPFEGAQKVLMIFDAESPEAIETTLADDPWTQMGLLTTLTIDRWQIRLGREVLRT